MYLRGDLLLSIIFRMITQWFGNMVFTINLEIKKNIGLYTCIYILLTSDSFFVQISYSFLLLYNHNDETYYRK